MIEENPFEAYSPDAIVDRDPVCIELGHGVGGSRVERCALVCGVSWTFLRVQRWMPGRSGSWLPVQGFESLPKAARFERIGVGRVLRGFEADLYMTLGG